MERLGERLFSFASIADQDALYQAGVTASMPFVFPWVAAMPDVHVGKGACVGLVIPTRRALMPAAVGVDIGCGMLAVRTQFYRHELPGDLTALRVSIEQAIPLSPGRYNTTTTASAAAAIAYLHRYADSIGFDPAERDPSWPSQLGTLGSGNHFIEISLDELDRIWLFLHSGSRRVGLKIATRHITVAQSFCERHWIPLPHKDLAYLVEGTDEFSTYRGELMWAQEFAKANRREMMDRVVQCVGTWHDTVQPQDTVHCHHNYTAQERHYDASVWVSRKGAINAADGVRGLIPGSMGAESFVVVGQGNRVSLHSAPHGAGRRLSRRRAAASFTEDDLRAAMTGVNYRHTAAILDEHPDAYKDIGQVMTDAKDLVTVQHTLRQIINVKGT